MRSWPFFLLLLMPFVYGEDKDLIHYNKKANRFVNSSFKDLVNYSRHVAKAISSLGVPFSKAISQCLDIGYKHLTKDDKDKFDLIYESLMERYQQQSIQINELEANILSMALQEQYSTIVSTPLMHLRNRFQEIKTKPNYIEARQNFRDYCKSPTSNPEIILDRIEYHTTESCNPPTPEHYRNLMEAETFLEALEKKLVMNEKESENYKILKDKYLLISFEATESSLYIFDDIKNNISSKNVLDVLFSKTVGFNPKCWLKQVFINSKMKRSAIEKAASIILIDLARTKGLYPDMVKKRCIELIPNTFDDYNATAKKIQNELNQLAQSNIKYNLLLSNIVSDSSIFFYTTCFDSSECVNFIYFNTRVLIFPVELNFASASEERASHLFNEAETGLRKIFEDNRGTTYLQGVYEIMKTKYPELFSYYQNVVLLDNTVHSGGLDTGMGLQYDEGIPLFKVIFEENGEGIFKEETQMFLLQH